MENVLFSLNGDSFYTQYHSSLPTIFLTRLKTSLGMVAVPPVFATGIGVVEDGVVCCFLRNAAPPRGISRTDRSEANGVGWGGVVTRAFATVAWNATNTKNDGNNFMSAKQCD